MSTESIVQRLNELGLSKVPNEIIERSEERVLMLLERKPENKIPLGASKIGGVPHLPKSNPWPSAKVPLAFFLQINFKEVSPFDIERTLPSTGMLYIFIAHKIEADIDESKPGEKWSVFYHDCGEEAVAPCAPPAFPAAGDDEEIVDIPASQISFLREIQWPEDFEDFYNDLLIEEDEELLPQLDSLKVKRNEKNVSALSDTLRPSKEKSHQLIGHPAFSGCEPPKGYRLLLKIDSDYKQLECKFVSSGVWFFYIKPEDLKRRDFSKLKVRLNFD